MRQSLNHEKKQKMLSDNTCRLLLTLSRRRPLLYRNQSIDLLWKSMDWFLYDNSPRHERPNGQYQAAWNTKQN